MISIFQRARLTSLFNISQNCVLCDQSTIDAVCQPCQQSLSTSTHACPVCAAPSQRQICGTCLRDQPHFDASVAAFTYQYPLDRLVRSFKFGANLTLVDFFADALAAKISQNTNSEQPLPTRIIALPLANKRLATRGFNQSALLADALAHRLTLKVAHQAMRRIRETPPQTGLSKALRLKNIKGAFECVANVANQHIAIVDDVMTTGATLSEAAKVLKLAGARSVTTWIIARAVVDVANVETVREKS